MFKKVYLNKRNYVTILTLTQVKIPFFKLEYCHSCFALKRHNNIYSQLKLTKSEIMARPNSMRIV